MELLVFFLRKKWFFIATFFLLFILNYCSRNLNVQFERLNFPFLLQWHYSLTRLWVWHKVDTKTNLLRVYKKVFFFLFLSSLISKVNHLQSESSLLQRIRTKVGIAIESKGKHVKNTKNVIILFVCSIELQLVKILTSLIYFPSFQIYSETKH